MTESIQISRDTNGEIVTTTAEERAEARVIQAPASSGLSSRVHKGAASVSIRGGGNEVQTQQHERAVGNTSDIIADKMADNPGSVLASARSSSGRPLASHELTPDSIVTIDGMETSVATAERMGILGHDEQGYYDVGSNFDNVTEPEVPEVIPGLPEFVIKVVNVALDGLSEVDGTQLLFNAVTGKLDGDDDVVKRAADTAGKGHDQMVAELTTAASGIYGHIGQQFDTDAEGAIEMAEVMHEYDAEGLQNALRILLMANDVRPLLELADKVVGQMPVDVNDLKDKGLTTKRENGVDLVYATDPDTGLSTWVRVEVAAKLRWI